MFVVRFSHKIPNNDNKSLQFIIFKNFYYAFGVKKKVGKNIMMNI